MAAATKPAPAPATPTAPPRLKSHERADLVTFCDLLHLAHHRNLNQHRHSIWWRHFSVFRRELAHFVAEYDAYQPPADTPASQRPSAKASKAAARRAAARLEAWRRDCVPRWYLAFADVIASTQFSALGLALLAVLARVAQVTGITAAYEDEAERAMQAVLQKFAAMDAKRVFGAVGEDEQRGAGRAEGMAMEDVGEVVSRREEDAGEVVARDAGDGKDGDEDAPAAKSEIKRKGGSKGGEKRSSASTSAMGLDLSMKKKKKVKRTMQLEPEPGPGPEPTVVEPPKKKKKTKKAKSSAIDDLFAGL